MRNAICIVLMILGTFFISAYAYNLIGKANAVTQKEVGPHKTFTWTTAYILTLDGTYTLSSPSYFELTQGKDVRQSTYNPPEVGQENGRYLLTDDLKGDWRIESYATMYTLEDSTFTATHTTSDKVFNGFWTVIAALFVWVILLKVVSYFMD